MHQFPVFVASLDVAMEMRLEARKRNNKTWNYTEKATDISARYDTAASITLVGLNTK